MLSKWKLNGEYVGIESLVVISALNVSVHFFFCMCYTVVEAPEYMASVFQIISKSRGGGVSGERNNVR